MKNNLSPYHQSQVTTIILTYNESIHIERAIKNILRSSKDVFILDSGSNDDTVAIAEKLGAKVFYRKFDNYAKQRTYAIKELPIKTEWVLFLDADEYLTAELKEEITQTLSSTDKDGFYLKRRFIFMNKWIKYGGYYPTWILRLFKKDKATIDREMNEHVVVDGEIGYLKNDFIDHNLKGLKCWVEKHKKYADFEAKELINKSSSNDKMAKLFGSQAERKRWIRKYVWDKVLPLFVRVFFRVFYRYILKLGFLDGSKGLIYYTLHDFWYPMMIDYKYVKLKFLKKK